MEFLQARWGCKNPSPRRGRTTGPPIKMDGVRRMEEGGEWRSVARGVEGGGRAGNGGVAQGGGGGVGSGMCHPHILAASLLINFSHDQL